MNYISFIFVPIGTWGSLLGVKTAVVANPRRDTCSREVLRHEVSLVMRAVIYQLMVEAMVSLVLHLLSPLIASKKFMLGFLTNSKNRYPKGTCVEYVICINGHEPMSKVWGYKRYRTHKTCLLPVCLFPALHALRNRSTEQIV